MAALLLMQLSVSRAQFSETIFYDSLTKVTNDGFIHSGITEGKFIYLSGSSFSEESPLPSVTKTDTAGNVIWTAADNENAGRFGNYYGYGSSMSTCKSTFKSGNRLYSIAEGLVPQSNPVYEIWCISDSAGVLLWKTPIAQRAVKIVDYSPTELLLITGSYDYEYHIINKITGKLVFTKFIATHSLTLVNDPNILVDAQKNILISWDDNCQKYRDRELTQLLWTSHLPNNGSLRMIDMVIQDSGRYLLVGNNYARAIDSLTGNTIWYKPIQVGYVQGSQSGDDGNPKAVIVKDSSLYITWVSPYVGGVDLTRGYTLTRINTGNGNVGFNVAYDPIGIPPDVPGPPSSGELDWPMAMSMDANNQIYLTGSYDYGAGMQNPGNWGIMKINGITGAKIYESTITEDSTKRMTLSQGRFLYYYNGKMYCAGNVNKNASNYFARPLILSFDTTSTYQERYRINPYYVNRYPSSLIGIAPFSSQKMVLLKKIGQSGIIELRNTNNQLIWSRTFSSSGKFVVPQNLISLGDTSVAASFIMYTKNTRYKASLGLPDSILIVRLDSTGVIAYQRSLAVSNTDTILPVQVYTDKFGKTNFIYLSKNSTGAQRFGNMIFMLNSPATVFGYVSVSEYYNFRDIPKKKITRLQHYFGDTTIIYFSDENTSFPLRNRGFMQSATQAASGSYTGYPGKAIDGFSRVLSTIKLDSISLFIMGKSEAGTIMGARYNHRLATPLVWSQLSVFGGAMFSADTSKSSIYTVSEKTGGILSLLKLGKAAGNIVWNFDRTPLTIGSYNNLDLKYNKIKESFTSAGYFADSSVTGSGSGYYYISLDSSGNVIKDILKPGFGITESRVNSVDILPSGTNIYGGSLGTAEWGTVGFYNSDCAAANVVPVVTISTPATTFCNIGTAITFTATAINTGLSPVYQWQVNGVNAGTNSATFTTTTLNNNDQVKLILTSNGSCLQTNIATSNVITMMIANGTLVPAVSITSSATATCAGIPVIFTAVATYPGTNPVYQWQVNGVNAGTNSNTFTVTPNNNDQVKLILTSNASCLLTNTATSNIITITTGAPVNPAVSITANPTSICAGTTVTFTATTTNGGTSPAFQWQVNGVNAGTNASQFITSSLVSNDQVKVKLTSNAGCLITPTAQSNVITMLSNTQQAPVISISGNTASVGQYSFLTARVINPGPNPAFQWQDSTQTHTWRNINGAADSTINFITYLVGNKIRCRLTVTICLNQVTVLSNVLGFTANFQGTGLAVYPQPAYSVLHIDNLNLTDKWETLDLIYGDGKALIISKDISNQTKIVLQLSNLPPGIYYAVLRRSDGKPVHIKFLKG